LGFWLNPCLVATFKEKEAVEKYAKLFGNSCFDSFDFTFSLEGFA
jgi:hypothetical protein